MIEKTMNINEISPYYPLGELFLTTLYDYKIREIVLHLGSLLIFNL